MSQYNFQTEVVTKKIPPRWRSPSRFTSEHSIIKRRSGKANCPLDSHIPSLHDNFISKQFSSLQISVNFLPAPFTLTRDEFNKEEINFDPHNLLHVHTYYTGTYTSNAVDELIKLYDELVPILLGIYFNAWIFSHYFFQELVASELPWHDIFTRIFI